MNQPLVKICGVREAEHARAAVEAGADMIGLVFYPPSHRNVTPDEAAVLAEVVREADRERQVKLVGLFVDEPAEHINEIADEVGLDMIQLAGNEPPGMIAHLSRPAIASVRVDSSGKHNEEQRFQDLLDTEPPPWAILVDSHIPGMYGGTGTVADWFVAADFARRYHVVLAGGLRPETVGAAIRRVRPFAVDVSSGVETNKRKDAEKIRAFVAAAKGSPLIAGCPDSVTTVGQKAGRQ